MLIPILYEDATKTLPFPVVRGKVPKADKGKNYLVI
jgi:hypothetical protein